MARLTFVTDLIKNADPLWYAMRYARSMAIPYAVHSCFDFNSSICAKIMAYSFVQCLCDFYHPPLSHTPNDCAALSMSIVHSISSSSKAHTPTVAQTEWNLCHLHGSVMHQFPSMIYQHCTSKGMIWSEMTTAIENRNKKWRKCIRNEDQGPVEHKSRVCWMFLLECLVENSQAAQIVNAED